jgi:glycosyltransferase involved in cell wall biosynthesis
VNGLGIDIIVPCHNYGRYLRQCVHSVLRETRLDLRILIIDDASSDGSAEEACRLAAEDDRIEVRVHPTNHGHIATFNEGLKWVRQDYMLLLSADDMVAPHALIRAVQLMEEQPDIALVFGRAIRFRAESELPDAPPRVLGTQRYGRHRAGLGLHRPALPQRDEPGGDGDSRGAQRGPETCRGLCAALHHSADFEMWLRCARHGRVGEIAAVQAYVRLHGANMRDGYCAEDALGDYRQRRDAFLSFFDRTDEGPGRGVLRGVALRNLAQNLLWDASRAVEQRRDCSQIVALAIEIHPDIRRTSQYRRLVIKRGLHQVLGFRKEGSCPLLNVSIDCASRLPRKACDTPPLARGLQEFRGALDGAA